MSFLSRKLVYGALGLAIGVVAGYAVYKLTAETENLENVSKKKKKINTTRESEMSTYITDSSTLADTSVQITDMIDQSIEELTRYLAPPTYYAAFNSPLPERNILMLGLDGSGKTAFLKRISKMPYHNCKPTEGYNMIVVNSKKARYTFCELGGVKGLRQFQGNKMEKIDVLAWFVDGADEDRILESAHVFNDTIKSPRYDGTGVLLVVTKDELPGLGTNQIVDLFKMQSMKDRLWTVVSISTFSGTGFIDFFDRLAAVQQF